MQPHHASLARLILPFPDAMRIGILGGSFDPPHAGHVLIAREAIRRLRLDILLWSVNRQNPIKPDAAHLDLDARITAAGLLTMHIPQIRVLSLERAARSTRSVTIISQLRRMRPQLHFVWIMGADCLAGMHHWQKWPQLFERVPIAVFDRPGPSRQAMMNSPAAIRHARWRRPGEYAPQLAQMAPPAWCLVRSRLLDLSSTQLRAAASHMRGAQQKYWPCTNQRL